MCTTYLSRGGGQKAPSPLPNSTSNEDIDLILCVNINLVSIFLFYDFYIISVYPEIISAYQVFNETMHTVIYNKHINVLTGVFGYLDIVVLCYGEKHRKQQNPHT